MLVEAGVDPDKVGGLTRLRAIYLYLHPRNKKGGLEPYGPPRSLGRAVRLSAREEFEGVQREKGLPGWRIRQVWDEMAERAKRLAAVDRDARLEAVKRIREKEGRRGRS